MDSDWCGQGSLPRAVSHPFTRGKKTLPLRLRLSRACTHGARLSSGKHGCLPLNTVFETIVIIKQASPLPFPVVSVYPRLSGLLPSVLGLCC